MSVLGSWDPSIIPALSALCGSLVGALGSSAGTWITQRHQNRRDLLAKKISQREQLYSDFINENARVLADAVQHTFEDPSKLISIYALISRIRLSSSKEVVESADQLVKKVLKTYSEPNLTCEEIQSNVEKGDDPLREFSGICRHELESLWNGF